MKRKIDFLIIGAQKSGTTTLYNWLGQHPDIFLPSIKEILYFAKDEFYEQGEGYLDVFYKKLNEEKVVGGAYVHLMYFSHTAKRIYNYNPNMKLIAVLRNPVDRAYSAYWFARANGWETETSFDKALAREPERLIGTYQEQAELTYIAHGKYAEQIQAYLGFFTKKQIFVLLTEELRNQPNATMKKVFQFLDVAPKVNNLDFEHYSNQASYPRFLNLQRFLMSKEDTWYKTIGRKLMSTSTRIWIRKHIIRTFVRWNRQPFQYPPMNPETRRRLQILYAPYNKELGVLIGKDLQHWK